MKPRKSVVFFAITSLTLFGACASAPKDAGFTQVRQDVKERIGADIRWDSSDLEHQAIEKRVEELLKDGLTLQEAVQIALLNDHELQAVYENLALARADFIQAGLIRNPFFDLELKFVKGDGGELLELRLFQPLFDALFIPMRRKVAEAEFEATKLKVTAAILSHSGRTIRAFYQYVGDLQTVELLRTVAEATQSSYEAALALREAGNITLLALRGEQALYEHSRLQLAQSELAAQESRARLNQMMGLWGQRTDWDVGGRLPEVPPDPIDTIDLERRAIECSLDLAAARQDIEAAGKRLGLTKVREVVRRGGIGVAAEREPDRTWLAGPSFAVEIPIFDFGQGKVPRAEAIMRQAYQRFASLAVRIRTEVEATAIRLLSAQRQAIHYKSTLLPLSQQILEQAQRQYNAMQVGVFQLLDVKQQQINTGIGYIGVLRSYWIVRSQLDQILMGVLPDKVPGLGVESLQFPIPPILNNNGGH